MLQMRDDDLVAGANVLAPEGRRDEVDRFRRAARENDVFDRPRIEETCDFGSRAFVGVRRACCEFVSRAVNVRVLVLIEIFEPLDDRSRLLRRRRVVEPYERAAVDRLVEDGKIAAYSADIKPAPTTESRRGLATRSPDLWSRSSRRSAVEKIEG